MAILKRKDGKGEKTMEIPTLSSMMAAGLHFGHVTKYWQPKMKPYIFLRRDKIHVINLEKTRDALKDILPRLTKHVASGKNLLLIGTKKQIRSIVTTVGQETHIPYVDLRWLGGTLTNFPVMKNSLKRMKEIEEILMSEKSQRMIKKERLNLERQLKRMKEKFGGLANLTKVPEAIFVIDPHHEQSAIKEAKVCKIEIYALADTNSDPTDIDYLIPGNDDAFKSVELIMGLIKEAIFEGQKAAKAQAQTPEE